MSKKQAAKTGTKREVLPSEEHGHTGNPTVPVQPLPCKACEGKGVTSKGKPCPICSPVKTGTTKEITVSVPLLRVGDVIETKREGAQTPLLVVGINYAGEYTLANAKGVKLNMPYDDFTLDKYGFAKTGHLSDAEMPVLTDPDYSIKTTMERDMMGGKHVKVKRVAAKETKTEPKADAPAAATPAAPESLEGWSVKPATPKYSAGGYMLIDFKCFHGQTPTAYIGVVQSDTPHNRVAVNKACLAYTYLVSKQGCMFISGSVMLPVPKTTGEYDVRLLSGENSDGQEAASAMFKVE